MRETHRERHTEKETHRERDTQTHRDTHRHRDRERDTETQRHTPHHHHHTPHTHHNTHTHHTHHHTHTTHTTTTTTRLRQVCDPFLSMRCSCELMDECSLRPPAGGVARRRRERRLRCSGTNSRPSAWTWRQRCTIQAARCTLSTAETEDCHQGWGEGGEHDARRTTGTEVSTSRGAAGQSP